MKYIFMYLTAIVLANITTALWGPGMSVFNAFLFIGLDLTARDSLHEAWKGKGLWWKMVLLIATGSILSWVLNRDAGQIAIASFVAFAVAGLIDAVIYHILGDKTRMVKVNGSNVVSAFADSLIFPLIAFGSVLPLITLGQFIAKVAGGFLWMLVLSKLTTPAQIGE